MRRIQTLNSKKPPKGFDIIEPQITELIQRFYRKYKKRKQNNNKKN